MLSDRRARGWLRVHPTVADAALAAALFGLWLAIVLVPAEPDLPDLSGTAIVVAALGVVPTALRRLVPRWAVALQCLTVLLPQAFGAEVGPEGLSVLVVAYTAASVLPLRQAAASAVALGAAGTLVLLLDSQLGADAWISNALTLLVSFFVGRTVLNRRAYTAALEERARAAETSREAAAREAVLTERRRIARELRDVVAHHVSVMSVLAAGARRTLGRDPDAADEALQTIEETGRSTLREMRRLLDVLRTDADDDTAPVAPQPGVDRLAALVGQVREAGLQVRLRVEGEARPLEPGIDLTVYRIVQEGLTNTLKHGGMATAEVVLRYGPDRVQVEVRDDGRGPRPGPATSTGHGLVGMRERVGLYGGALHTGPRREGGYVVRADIPLDEALEVTR